MKFSDVILAMASLLLISWSLYPVLAIASVPLNSNTASDVLSYIICILVGALIVGYVLAPKIHEESKVKAIGSVAVLSAFVMMAFLMVWYASPQGNRWFMDGLNSTFNRTTWTDYDLTVYSALLETMDTVIALVLSFMGLYVGSMLRKPSAKTKE